MFRLEGTGAFPDRRAAGPASPLRIRGCPRSRARGPAPAGRTGALHARARPRSARLPYCDPAGIRPAPRRGRSGCPARIGQLCRRGASRPGMDVACRRPAAAHGQDGANGVGARRTGTNGTGANGTATNRAGANDAAAGTARTSGAATNRAGANGAEAGTASTNGAATSRAGANGGGVGTASTNTAATNGAGANDAGTGTAGTKGTATSRTGPSSTGGGYLIPPADFGAGTGASSLHSGGRRPGTSASTGLPVRATRLAGLSRPHMETAALARGCPPADGLRRARGIGPPAERIGSVPGEEPRCPLRPGTGACRDGLTAGARSDIASAPRPGRRRLVGGASLPGGATGVPSGGCPDPHSADGHRRNRHRRPSPRRRRATVGLRNAVAPVPAWQIGRAHV